MPAALEHVEEAGEVGPGIGMGIDQGMTHAGLRREVDDVGKAVLGEQCRHGVTVGDIGLLEAEAGNGLKLLNACLLEARIVIGVEVVEPDHPIAVRQQAAGHMHADEPGRAGDENRLWHNSSLSSARRRNPAPLRIALGAAHVVQYKSENAKSPLPASTPNRERPSAAEICGMSHAGSEAAALRRWLFEIALPLWW